MVFKIYKFIDKYGYGRPYIYVHPFKQKQVKLLVDTVEPWVEYIILFGSVVNLTCKSTSDIDICVIGSPPNKNNYIIGDIEGEHDIILRSSLDEIKDRYKSGTLGAIKDIVEKGIIVYAKQKDVA